MMDQSIKKELSLFSSNFKKGLKKLNKLDSKIKKKMNSFNFLKKLILNFRLISRS